MTNTPFDLLRPMSLGLILALAAMLFGFGMGIAFGAAEDSLKNGLTRSASAVADSVYQGDSAKIKSVTDKAWAYYKRAHLHAGALGANALALILLMAFLTRTPSLLRAIVAFALGFGALGYSLFWLLAGIRAPSLGSTSAAKESLNWLAIPTSASIVLACLAVFLMLLVQIPKRK